MSDFAQSIQTNYPSTVSPSFEPHSQVAATTLPPMQTLPTIPSQSFNSVGGAGPHMPAPIVNVMAAPAGPMASVDPSTTATTKTPNLQSNMFKMQRNRSNFLLF